MVKIRILTEKEQEVLEKRLNNEKVTQADSNRLSRQVRPKLKAMLQINAQEILNRIEYKPETKKIENIIIKSIRNTTKEIDSIILYGSAIQNNYHEYNDIDILLVIKNKIDQKTKAKKIIELKNILSEKNIVSDIEIITKENLINSYKNSPTLIYQLKDHKVIYGNIKVPKKIELYNADLQMKLDWSDIEDINPTGKEIYGAIRNVLLVRLLLNRIIDNSQLKQSVYEQLGKSLANKLKTNTQTSLEKKVALNYLKELLNSTRKQIGGNLWEKVTL